MSGLFGVVSHNDCVKDLFYGTDYHSHLGTQKAGLAVWNKKLGGVFITWAEPNLRLNLRRK